jgi:hypothetical protein
MESVQWEAATAAFYLGMSFAEYQKCASFRDMLLENGLKDLKASYGNITGHVPHIICELIQSNEAMRRVDLANAIACIRYNQMAIKKRPVHMVQITTRMRDLVEPELPQDSRRSTFLQTMKFLVDAGMGDRQACATSYLLHHQPPREKPAKKTVEIQSRDIRAHHSLPNTYLAVDSVGGVWIMDTTRGVYQIPTATPVPNGWVCRVDPDSNTFIAGDDGQCVSVVLNEALDACMQTPLVLPDYPSVAQCVDYRWVVWGSRKRPHAFQHKDGAIKMCATSEAKMHVMSRPFLNGTGNCVTLDGEVVCCIPDDQNITCTYGTPRDVDVVTSANDFWRIDVVNNRAWCVGMELGDAVIVALAPLVGWN